MATYKGPNYSAWRKPIYLDANDPRAKSAKEFNKFSARAGAEVSIKPVLAISQGTEYEDAEIGTYLSGFEYTTMNLSPDQEIPTITTLAIEYTTANVI